MAAPSHIEVVGGEARERAQLVTALAAAGFEAVARSGDIDAGASLVVAVGGDPAAACRRVRENPDRAGVPVLAVISSGAAGEVTACMDAGADDILLEPAEIPVLGARIRSLLGAAAEMRRARSREGSQQALLEAHALMSAAEVTAQRAPEAELRKTKDFLERLIDSTVDGIIAADMRGQVIIFNSGAERIYGYRADQVIGQVPVWSLYPESVARQVMSMLRSSSYGGVGRLEQTRREVVGKDGELVPVNLTASLIYEGEREVASVGVFSDLRERIRIEQRLLVAQEKLELREKQAVVAGIAGAAAHELNQPLTSIMGYTSLIRRQSDAEAPHLRALDVIEDETERMAEIVKKIGRITRFETKEYVGGANILDLERSVSPGDGAAVITEPVQGEDEDARPAVPHGDGGGDGGDAGARAGADSIRRGTRS